MQVKLTGQNISGLMKISVHGCLKKPIYEIFADYFEAPKLYL